MEAHDTIILECFQVKKKPICFHDALLNYVNLNILIFQRKRKQPFDMPKGILKKPIWL